MTGGLLKELDTLHTFCPERATACRASVSRHTNDLRRYDGRERDDANQKRPDTRPSSSTSIVSAAGFLGRPGIVMMSPQIATTKPAPAKRRVLSTCSVNPDGRPPFFGSSEKEYGVLAMTIGQVAEALLLVAREAVLGLLRERDAARAVEPARDDLDLLGQGPVPGIERPVAGRAAGDLLEDEPGEVLAAGAAAREDLGEGDLDVELGAALLEERDLGRRVRREAVDRDDRRQAEDPDVVEVPLEVQHAPREGREVLDGRACPWGRRRAS